MNINQTWAGAAVATVLACSGQAGAVDWGVSYQGVVDQSQTSGSDQSFPLYRNLYGWDRNVSAWQEFKAGTSGPLGGIAVQLMSAAANGSVDLNIYAGQGVLGTPLETTHLTWTGSFDGTWPYSSWYAFQLSAPVDLTAGSTYTFSFENLNADNGLRYVVNHGGEPWWIPTDGDPYPNGEYTQQGYFWGTTFGYGEGSGSTTADMNFKTIMAVPEPVSTGLAMSGLILVGTLIWRRR
jgi:hypothetical protein